MEEKIEPQPAMEPEAEILTPSFWEKLKANKFKILGGVLGILVLAGAVFGAYKLGQRQIQPTPAPSPAVVVAPTPDPTVNWQTYTNTEYKYLIKYPEGWFLNFDSPGSQQFSDIESESPFDTRVRVDVNSINKEYFNEKYNSEVGTKWEAEFKVTEEKKANLIIANEPAVKLIRMPSEGATSPAYIVRILVVKNDDIFEISSWGTDREDQQKYDAVFNLMLSTFRFLEEEDFENKKTSLSSAVNAYLKALIVDKDWEKAKSYLTSAAYDFYKDVDGPTQYVIYEILNEFHSAEEEMNFYNQQEPIFDVKFYKQNDPIGTRISIKFLQENGQWKTDAWFMKEY